jgi:hypothetical protein
VSAPLLVAAVMLGALTAVAFGPTALQRAQRGLASRRAARSQDIRPEPTYDPGRERRAERKALELLRDTVGEEEYAMYASLGFLRVLGEARDGGRYGYLIYPHRPIVAYDAATGELLSEYCVGFPDRAEGAYGSRLPDADDVLAKWMSLQGDERGLLEHANMHLPGRQIDPGQVRRDLRRLREWEARVADERLGVAA